MSIRCVLIAFYAEFMLGCVACCSLHVLYFPAFSGDFLAILSSQLTYCILSDLFDDFVDSNAAFEPDDSRFLTHGGALECFCCCFGGQEELTRSSTSPYLTE